MEGYKQNALGHLVPIDQIHPIDLARDELVMEKAEKIKAMQEELRRLKAEIMGDVEAFVAMSAEQYDAQIGGPKGNVTLISFDGRYKLRRQISQLMSFDERLQVAKSLIDECLKDWTKDSRTELQALVNDAFDVDQEGRINTGRILGLRRLNIDDPRWLRAMDAISDSLQITGTTAYVRLYERQGSTDRYVSVPLDMAVV